MQGLSDNRRFAFSEILSSMDSKEYFLSNLPRNKNIQIVLNFKAARSL